MSIFIVEVVGQQNQHNIYIYIYNIYTIYIQYINILGLDRNNSNVFSLNQRQNDFNDSLSDLEKTMLRGQHFAENPLFFV